jgi:hypothetical protein
MSSYHVPTDLVCQAFDEMYLSRDKPHYHNAVVEAILIPYGSHINVQHMSGVSQPSYAVDLHMDEFLLHYH